MPNRLELDISLLSLLVELFAAIFISRKRRGEKIISRATNYAQGLGHISERFVRPFIPSSRSPGAAARSGYPRLYTREEDGIKQKRECKIQKKKKNTYT
jgi:hypothetical protein